MPEVDTETTRDGKTVGYFVYERTTRGVPTPVKYHHHRDAGNMFPDSRDYWERKTIPGLKVELTAEEFALDLDSLAARHPCPAYLQD